MHFLEHVLVTVIVFKWAFLSSVRVCVRSPCLSPSFFGLLNDIETRQNMKFSQVQLCTFERVSLQSFHIQCLTH